MPSPFSPPPHNSAALQPQSILPQGFLLPSDAAHIELPLQGVTILAVEDSRFACEALRLISRRSGARLRRAETLKAARAHLRVYRPDVAIIDLGLPDGRGEALIRELMISPRRPRVVLGTSGTADGRISALSAGADGFLEKPLDSLGQFCDLLRGFLPNLGLSRLAEETITPDPLALQDDLAQAARRLDQANDAATRSYVTGFLLGVADHAHDKVLVQAARAAAGSGHDMQDLRRLVGSRLDAGAAAFGGKGAL